MRLTRWLRVILCGFAAGLVWYLLSVASVSICAPNLLASVQSRATHAARGGGFFFALDILMGIWAVWLNSALTPRYGARPATAAIAGFAWWTMKTLQSAKWAGLGLVEIGGGLLPLGVMTLIAAVLASMSGAWLYSKVSVPTGSEPRGLA